MKKNEKGITLIAVIISVVLLMIITAIVISTLDVNEGVDKTRSTANLLTEKYNNMDIKEKSLREQFNELYVSNFGGLYGRIVHVLSGRSSQGPDP